MTELQLNNVCSFLFFLNTAMLLAQGWVQEDEMRYLVGKSHQDIPTNGAV